MPIRILAIEDERAISDLLVDALEFEGFRVSVARSASEGARAALSGLHDLILLDLKLPDGNGFELCGSIRRQGIRTPVVILTGRGETVDKVRGLEAGADDYVTKPFDPQELVARIRAILRRLGAEPDRPTLRLGDLLVSSKERTVRRGSRQIELTKTEFDLLAALLQRPGEAVSRDELLDSVWEGVFVTPRTVDAHIASLRKKIERDPSRPRLIETVRGVGYRARRA